MTLHALQTRLAHALGERGMAGEAARAVLADLAPLPRVSAESSLGLYQGAVESVLRGALREIFPVCAALVGDDCFRAIVRAYARARPSGRADLGRCGDALPDFLPQLTFLEGVPYLPEVAALELACHAAYRAPGDGARLAPEAAHAIGAGIAAAPASWRLLLLPSVSLLHSRHPILEIWRAHQPGAGEGALESLDLSGGGDRLIVWRSERDVCVERVGLDHWLLLEAIAEQRSAAALLEIGTPGLALLPDLFSRGWIAGIVPSANGPAAVNERDRHDSSTQNRRSTTA